MSVGLPWARTGPGTCRGLWGRAKRDGSLGEWAPHPPALRAWPPPQKTKNTHIYGPRTRTDYICAPHTESHPPAPALAANCSARPPVAISSSGDDRPSRTARSSATARTEASSYRKRTYLWPPHPHRLDMCTSHRVAPSPRPHLPPIARPAHRWQFRLAATKGPAARPRAPPPPSPPAPPRPPLHFLVSVFSHQPTPLGGCSSAGCRTADP